MASEALLLPAPRQATEAKLAGAYHNGGERSAGRATELAGGIAGQPVWFWSFSSNELRVWEHRSCRRAPLATVSLPSLRAVAESDEPFALEHVAPITVDDGLSYLVLALNGPRTARIIYHKLSFQDRPPLESIKLADVRITALHVIHERHHSCDRLLFGTSSGIVSLVHDPRVDEPLSSADLGRGGPITALATVAPSSGRGERMFVVGQLDGSITILKGDALNPVSHTPLPSGIDGAVLRIGKVRDGIVVVRGSHPLLNAFRSSGPSVTNLVKYFVTDDGQLHATFKWTPPSALSSFPTSWQFADFACHDTPKGGLLCVAHNSLQAREASIWTIELNHAHEILSEEQQRMPQPLLAMQLCPVAARLARLSLTANSMHTEFLIATPRQIAESVNTQAYFARLRRLYSSPAFVRRVEERRRRRQRLYVDAMFERIPRTQFAFHTYPPHDPEAIYKVVNDPMNRALLLYYMLRDLPGNEETEAMATDAGVGIVADGTRLQDRLGIPVGRARLIDAYWLLDNEIEPEIVLGSLVHPLSVPFQPTLLSGLSKPEAGLKALTLLGTAAPWAHDELEDEEAVAIELAGLVRKLMEARQFQAALAVQRAHDDESHTLLRTLLQALASMDVSEEFIADFLRVPFSADEEQFLLECCANGTPRNAFLMQLSILYLVIRARYVEAFQQLDVLAKTRLGLGFLEPLRSSLDAVRASLSSVQRTQLDMMSARPTALGRAVIVPLHTVPATAMPAEITLAAADSGELAAIGAGPAPLSSQRFAASHGRAADATTAQQSLLRLINEQTAPIAVATAAATAASASMAPASAAATPLRTPAARLHSSVHQLSTRGRFAALAAGTPSRSGAAAAVTPRRAHMPFIGPPSSSLRASVLVDLPPGAAFEGHRGDIDDDDAQMDMTDTTTTRTQVLLNNMSQLSRRDLPPLNLGSPPQPSPPQPSPPQPPHARAAAGASPPLPAPRSIRTLSPDVMDADDRVISESQLDLAARPPASAAATAAAAPVLPPPTRLADRRGLLASPPKMPARYVARTRAVDAANPPRPAAAVAAPPAAAEQPPGERASTPMRSLPVKLTPLAAAASPAAMPTPAATAGGAAVAQTPTPSLVRSFISSLQSPAAGGADTTPTARRADTAMRMEDFAQTPEGPHARSPLVEHRGRVAVVDMPSTPAYDDDATAMDATEPTPTPAKRTRRTKAAPSSSSASSAAPMSARSTRSSRRATSTTPASSARSTPSLTGDEDEDEVMLLATDSLVTRTQTRRKERPVVASSRGIVTRSMARRGVS